MADPRGFLTVGRAVPGDPSRDPAERVDDHREVLRLLPLARVEGQAQRCMQCGVPFCHRACPLGNLIPEWNELVERGRWRDALDRLLETNNFPEFTGFTCPAPCEPACTLEINDDPVMIKHVELSIIEHAFANGWVTPQAPRRRTGRTVAVVGSGPAGLAAAAQLNAAGHRVTVYERDEAVGGLLRFGIPDFKLEKHVIDRRVHLLEAEGVEFRCRVDVGVTVSTRFLLANHDAVVVAVGSRLHRELDVPGAKLDGVHVAMDYLYDRNRAVAAAPPAGGMAGPIPAHVGAATTAGANGHGATRRGAARHGGRISAAGRDVVVIGGGDTAADCMANANREGARSVTQLDRYPPPDGARPREIDGWPHVPKREPTNYAIEEGAVRRWGAVTVGLEGRDGRVSGVRVARGGPPDFSPVPGTEETLPADLVLVAIGFLRPEQDLFLDQLRVRHDDRGNIAADDYGTSREGVFACGDARRGQSLVVWAINEGRECAARVDRWLAELPD